MIEASYEGILLEALDTTTGSKTFLVSPALNNADGVLKVGIGLDNEEWFEVTGTNPGTGTITTTLRGLSLTTTNILTEVAGNRKEHFPGEKIAIVTFPNLFHSQNTDTGTTSNTFEINNDAFGALLTTAALTGDRTFTFPDLAGTFVLTDGAQILTSKTLTSPIINTSISGTAFLDEDNMISNSDTKVASQQSIKAYVDNSIASLPSGTTLTNAVLNGTISGTAITTVLGNPGVNTLLPTEKAVRDALVASIAGVASVNTKTGAITLTAGDALTVTEAPAGTFDFDVNLAIAAEVNTGTEIDKVINPDVLAGSNFGKRVVEMVIFNFTNDVSTGDGKFYFNVPSILNGMNLVEVHARVITAGVTGTTDIQIANVTQAADMLTTKITIDSAETGSETAAIPAVIDIANDDVATNDVLRIDIDAVSTTAPKGLITTLIFQLP